MASTASVVVDVKAKADLAALKQTKTELADLLESGRLTSEQFKALTAAYGDFSKKSTLPKVIEDLRGVEQQAKKTNDEIAKGADGAKNVHGEIKLWQFSMAKATGEATVLARELATGSFHARTLGAFLASFGLAIQGAAVVLITVVAAIKAAFEAAKVLREETEKGNAALIKSNEEWERMAANVRNVGDMAQFTRSFTDDIGKLDEKIHDLATKSGEVSGLRRGLQELMSEIQAAPKLNFLALFGLDQPIAHLLKPLSDELLEAARNQEQIQTKAIARNIQNAQAQQDNAVAIGASKTITVEYTDASGKLIKKQSDLYTEMGRLIDIQNAANTETRAGQKAYAEATEALAAHVKLMDQVAAANKVLDDHTKALNADVERQVKAGNAHFEQIEKEKQAQEDLAKSLIPTRENQHAIGEEITAVRARMEELDRNIQSQDAEWQNLDARLKNLTASYNTIGEVINGVTDNIRKMNAEVEKQVSKGNVGLEAAADLTKKINAEAAVRNAEGNKELSISEQVNLKKLETRQHYEAINKSAGTQVVTEAEIAKESDIAGESLRHQLEVREGTGTAQSLLNSQMKEYEMILQDIRQQQAVVKDQAFIGVDQQNLQMLRLYREEIVNVIGAMRDNQARKGGLTDPNEIARANQEAQKLAATYQRLASQVLTLSHQFQHGLQSWANSFGSTGQQLANTLQQTVGAALQSINQWIVTGKFNMQQLLQQIVLLGLQLVEQLIIQRVVAMINARLAETQAVASSKIIAAAWASAATAVTIATEGQAAYSAPGAVAIGLAGVQAALGLGSLHEGGPVRRRMHSGGLAADEVPIIAQEGEIMIQRSVAQAPGMSDFLLGINAGMFHTGGFVAGGRYHFGGGGEYLPDYRYFDIYSNPFTMPSGGGAPVYHPPNLPGITPGPADLNKPPFTMPDVGDTREQTWFNRMWAGFGTTPSTGLPAFGPTQISTNWINYPGVGLVPMAVPVTSDIPYRAAGHLPRKSTSHGGGIISRMHSGGAVGGGAAGGVHIYAFTDLKALTRHMASKDGQKIIFDTVKGRRIDLGIS